MEHFLDAGVYCEVDLTGGVCKLPEALLGAMLFGPAAKRCHEELAHSQSDRKWWHAEPLESVVGETHARFPSRSASVIDLHLTEEQGIDWLERPAEWWPLCECLRGTSRRLRLSIPPGNRAQTGAKQLIKRFPGTQFWLDPFVLGPDSGWQGRVRLAEYYNVLLSTRGLPPGLGGVWTDAQAQEALRFTLGEVGANALLYASGAAWEDLEAGRADSGATWLASAQVLDIEARKLILHGNALAVFSAA